MIERLLISLAIFFAVLAVAAVLSIGVVSLMSALRMKYRHWQAQRRIRRLIDQQGWR